MHLSSHAVPSFHFRSQFMVPYYKNVKINSFGAYTLTVGKKIRHSLMIEWIVHQSRHLVEKTTGLFLQLHSEQEIKEGCSTIRYDG